MGHGRVWGETTYPMPTVVGWTLAVSLSCRTICICLAPHELSFFLGIHPSYNWN